MEGGKANEKETKEKSCKSGHESNNSTRHANSSNCPANTSTQLITLVEITEERERNLPILCNNSITHISLKEK